MRGGRQVKDVLGYERVIFFFFFQFTLGKILKWIC